MEITTMKTTWKMQMSKTTNGAWKWDLSEHRASGEVLCTSQGLTESGPQPQLPFFKKHLEDHSNNYD